MHVSGIVNLGLILINQLFYYLTSHSTIYGTIGTLFKIAILEWVHKSYRHLVIKEKRCHYIVDEYGEHTNLFHINISQTMRRIRGNMNSHSICPCKQEIIRRFYAKLLPYLTASILRFVKIRRSTFLNCIKFVKRGSEIVNSSVGPGRSIAWTW